MTCAVDAPKSLCPRCIADGAAAEEYDACSVDAYFRDDEMNEITLSAEARRNVFSRTIEFASFNPIGWGIHCGEPAEYFSETSLMIGSLSAATAISGTSFRISTGAKATLDADAQTLTIDEHALL